MYIYIYINRGDDTYSNESIILEVFCLTVKVLAISLLCTIQFLRTII